MKQFFKLTYLYRKILRSIPTLFTLFSPVFSLSAVYMAMHHNAKRAVTYIVIAMVFDALDGRMARFIKCETDIGIELDSLADNISFGVAPVFIAYFLSLYKMPIWGFFVIIVYVLSALWRLAKFNTTKKQYAPLMAKFFFGIPSPAAAGIALVPIILGLNGLPYIMNQPIVYGIWILVVGFLMVSNMPMFSFKKIISMRSLVVFVVITVLFYKEHWYYWFILAVLGIYILTIPFSVINYLYIRRMMHDGKHNAHKKQKEA